MMSLRGRLIEGILAVAGALALVVACSTTSGGSPFGSGGGGNSGGSGGSGNSGGNGSGNSSSGGGINVGGSPSVGGSGGGWSGDACAATHQSGELVPLDMYVLMDQSGSMQGTSWNGVTQAITSFVNAGAPVKGISVGMQFFPATYSFYQCPHTIAPCTSDCGPNLGICVRECAVNAYLPPAVKIQPLPGVAPAIVSALNSHSPAGNTPTLPAMQAAVQVTSQYAQQHPNDKVIIVLATDGEPDFCGSTVANVSAEAAQALNSNPSVMTFVIGIGSVSNLNTIAQAGGSGSAIVVGSSSTNQDFLDALNKIRGKVFGCDFLMPKPNDGGTVDPKKVNVAYTPKGSSTKTLLGQVQDASQCGTKGGWYYDNPTNPTKITLCPTSCTQAKNGGSVDIQLGCQTVVVPPH